MNREVKDVMTRNPECCTRDFTLQEAAKLMVDCDCGAIPVVESLDSKKPIGMITDRDIACRAVAVGKDVNTLVSECMTDSAITAKENDSIDDVIQLMEENKIRRVAVVDQDGCCCGIVSQADLVEFASEEETGEVVREISQSSESPSAIH